MKKELKEVYSNAIAKGALNWGHVVSPLEQAFRMEIESAEMRRHCDEQCAVNRCYDREEFEMDWECAARKCRCRSKKQMTERRERNIENHIDTSKKRFDDNVEEFLGENEKAIKKIKERYQQRNDQILKQDLRVIRELLKENADCDNKCVNKCTNHKESSAQLKLQQLPECLEECECSVDSVKVEISGEPAYDYTMLQDYNRGHRGAWNYFLAHKPTKF